MRQPACVRRLEYGHFMHTMAMASDSCVQYFMKHKKVMEIIGKYIAYAVSTKCKMQQMWNLHKKIFRNEKIPKIFLLQQFDTIISSAIVCFIGWVGGSSMRSVLQIYKRIISNSTNRKVNCISQQQSIRLNFHRYIRKNHLQADMKYLETNTH
jgi:uncharacterized membrane protein